jgi:hypothetical protein
MKSRDIPIQEKLEKEKPKEIGRTIPGTDIIFIAIHSNHIQSSYIICHFVSIIPR